MNLIEQLEALPQVLAGEGPFYDICVKLSDVRAIIEQHKSDMGVNLQLQIAPTVILSKDFFGLSKDEGVLIQSWLNSAYEQIAEQAEREAVDPVAVPDRTKLIGELVAKALLCLGLVSMGLFGVKTGIQYSGYVLFIGCCTAWLIE